MPIFRPFLAAVLLCVLSVPAFAATPVPMPENLKGTWKLNATATEAAMRTSPKWDADAEKYWPRILKRMSQVRYILEDGKIIAAMGEKKKEVPVTVKSQDGDVTVFDATAGDKPFTMTATLDKDGNLNLKSSATDDMDFYWWEKE